MSEKNRELDEFFKKYIPPVEEYLHNYIEKERRYPERLYDALEYSLFAGGKRVRPLLCIAGYLLFDEQWERALPVAAALELIHTYSLIHDDLPAMDDDQIRRGKPTLHCAYNEYTALLAGDALLNMAFELLSSPDTGRHINPSTQLKILHGISTASGIKGMIGGQMADIMTEKEGEAVDRELLEFIHSHKTGALISVSLLSGALITEKVSAQDYSALQKFGRLLGLLFQIVDDLLDVTGNEEEMGKNTHKQGEKKIYPRVAGIEATRTLARRLNLEAQKEIDTFGEKGHILKQLCEFFERRTF